MFHRLFSDRHVWVEQRLSAYIDHQLTADERAHVDAHLRDCDRCQRSLASLQWTLALVKQAPAPVAPRSFVIPARENLARDSFAIAPAAPSPPRRVPNLSPEPHFAFSALRLSTALATLLLVALVGVDLVTQFGSAPAGAPAAEKLAAPTQAALAPQSAPVVTPTMAPQPTAAPLATSVSPRALPPPLTATPTLQAFRVPATEGTKPSAADAQQKPSPPAPLPAAGVAATSVPSPAPTRAAAVVPTASAPTTRAESRAAPTSATPISFAESPREAISPLRIAEVVVLVIAIGLGISLLIAGRRPASG